MTKKTKHKIFVTRPLSSEQIAYARALGIEPVIEPALRIEFSVNPAKIINKIDRAFNAPWVFTSKNGVEAFHRIQNSEFRIRNIPETYAVGDKTAHALKKLGVTAQVPVQQNASGLAKLIIGDKGKPTESAKPKIIHWCGNRSRPELKEQLAGAEIDLIPLEVYETYLNKIELPDKTIEAILFYSPSAVEAFRQSGGFKSDLPELLSIGNTTAESLSMESGQHVHVPSSPSTEALLELAAGILRPQKEKKFAFKGGFNKAKN